MTERTPHTIEHNRYELPNDRTPSKTLFGFFSVLWAFALYDNAPSWPEVMLGVGTGCLIASYAIVKTGNRVPESWRSPPTDKR